MNKKFIMIFLAFFVGITGILFVFSGHNDDFQATGTSSFTEELEEADIPVQPEEETEDLAKIKVYICGAVKKPGVYSLKDGSRLDDLVGLCGGFLKTSYVKELNLAERLTDGGKIYVKTKKEAKRGKNGEPEDGSSGERKDDGLVNLNTASKEELMTLPGIGEAKADKIMAYRQAKLFQSAEDIMNIEGIKSGVFEKIKKFIKV